MDVRLTGPAGTNVAGNSVSDDETVLLDPVPETGTYLLRVYAYARAGSYTLSVASP